MKPYKIKIAEPRAQPPLLINLTDLYKATSVPIVSFSFKATCFKLEMHGKSSNLPIRKNRCFCLLTTRLFGNRLFAR